MALPDAKRPSSESPPLRIGELLVRQGLIKGEQLSEVLALQNREKKLQKLPLGAILVEMGMLSETQRDALLNHPELRKILGNLALEKGLIDPSVLNHCLSMKGSDQLIGQVLVNKGFLSSDDLGSLLKEQSNSLRFGELAVSLGVIRQKDLNVALQIQKAPRKLGEILCDLGYVSSLDLNHILKKYNKQVEIGDILVSLGYLTQEQLILICEEQVQGSETLEQILIRKRIITGEQYQIALSKKYNIPFKDLNGFEYSEEDKKPILRTVSQKYAEKNKVLPISLEKNHLKLAMYDPENMVHVVYELKNMYSQFNISCLLITQEKFEELFEILYSKHLGGASKNQKGDGDDVELDIMELNIEEELGEKTEKTPVYGAHDVEAEELMNYIIKYGIINGASDIHIEQDREGVQLRYRIDGIMRGVTMRWLKEKLQDKVASVVSRIKVVANLDIAEKRLPQDGGFRLNYYDKEKGQKLDLDFRVATCRASAGENTTIRILDPRKARVGLENLNHSPHVLEQFKSFLKSPAGMILVCGPTGSGKSSTLYAALQYIYSPRTKIITAEDPIEYNFPGIMQTQVNPKIGLTFSRLLRSFLRHDPDVILVGEMRDEETAKIGFDAAQTGHLLLSTLHTNDAISAIPRLLDLKVEYGQIASSLMCVIAQRLVRRICTACLEEYVPESAEWNLLFKKYPSHIKFSKGKGCEVCNRSGYKGRTLVSEIFAVDSEISHALVRGYDENEITQLALESGMRTMLDDGLSKTDQLTLAEIIRVIPHDMIKAFRAKNQAQVMTDSLIESLMSVAKTPLKEDDLPETFRLSNPEIERGTIDLMMAKYEDLMVQDGGVKQAFEPQVFRDFISASFNEISQKYRCKSLTFRIGWNKQTAGVEIAALPIL